MRVREGRVRWGWERERGSEDVEREKGRRGNGRQQGGDTRDGENDKSEDEKKDGERGGERRGMVMERGGEGRDGDGEKETDQSVLSLEELWLTTRSQSSHQQQHDNWIGYRISPLISMFAALANVKWRSRNSGQESHIKILYNSSFEQLEWLCFVK